MLKCIQTTYCIAGGTSSQRNGAFDNRTRLRWGSMHFLLIFIVPGCRSPAPPEFSQDAKPPVGPGHASARRPNRALLHRRCPVPYAAQFKTHGKDTLNAGYSRSVFWLKVNLHYTAKDPRRHAPGFWNWPTRRLIAWTFTPGRQHWSLHASPPAPGSALPFSSREVSQATTCSSSASCPTSNKPSTCACK